MTRRKPHNVDWESWTEQLIREAQEEGQFDNLPGFGQPLQLEVPDDENWWVREKLRREELRVPSPAAQIRRDYDTTLEKLQSIQCVTTIRCELEQLNARIRAALYRCQGGPPCLVTTIDIEDYLAERGL